MSVIKVSTLKKNPNNPRIIKDKPYKKLINNILRYPSFLALRPIVHKEKIVYGGNQRLSAITDIMKMPAGDFNNLTVELDLSQDVINLWQSVRKDKAIPEEWVKDAAELNEDEVKAFIILDNRDFGEDDFEKLANEWDPEELASWNVNLKDWLPTDETKTVSFNVKKNDPDYVTFEQLMHIRNKTRLTQTMDEVRTKQKLDTLEEALMYLVESYHQNKRE